MGVLILPTNFGITILLVVQARSGISICLGMPLMFLSVMLLQNHFLTGAGRSKLKQADFRTRLSKHLIAGFLHRFDRAII